MATATNEHDVQDDIPEGDISEEEMLGLSDEERAALADDETETEKAAIDDKEEATAEASDEGKESTDSEAPEEADAEPEAQADEDAEVEPEDSPKEPPAREVGDLSALDSKLSEINNAIAELDAQVADGEIDLTDHIKQTRELQDAKTQLMLEKAEYIRNQNENAREVQIAWDMAIDRFYSDPANKAFDHPDNGGNEIAFETMRNWLIKLQEKTPGRTPVWYLHQAKRDVQGFTGMQQDEPAKKPEPKQRRKSALDGADIPRTLSDTPAAANNSVEDEFSYLEKLGGEELEAAVAKMTPAQMDRWARQ